MSQYEFDNRPFRYPEIRLSSHDDPITFPTVHNDSIETTSDRIPDPKALDQNGHTTDRTIFSKGTKIIQTGILASALIGVHQDVHAEETESLRKLTPTERGAILYCIDREAPPQNPYYVVQELGFVDDVLDCMSELV